MLRLNLTFDSFGGKDKVLDFLFERKLLNKTCPSCHKERPIYFETGKTIPRFRCGPCNVRMYCTTKVTLVICRAQFFSKIQFLSNFLFPSSNSITLLQKLWHADIESCHSVKIWLRSTIFRKSFK